MNAARQPSAYLDRLIDSAWNFVARPASPRPLAALRIGVAAVLILQALSLAGDLQVLYGDLGVVQWDVMDPRDGASAIVPGIPRIRWLADLLSPLGLTISTAVRIVFISYLTALGCLLMGWRTRTAAVVAWLTHLALNASGPASIYGVDQFANIALFYCAVMPVGYAWSLDVHAGRCASQPTAEARLALRVLQIHMSVVYLASGIEKAAGIQWWNGEAIWRAVNLPEMMSPLSFEWLASYPALAMFLALSTLAVELGYAFLVWPRTTRKWMALATLGLHAGIAVSMGLYSFAALMMVLTTSAFLVPDTTPATSLATAPRTDAEHSALLPQPQQATA